MSMTFKLKGEKTYTFTEKELARLLTNHLCIYHAFSSGKTLPVSTVEHLTDKTVEEIKNNSLIDNLNKDYSTLLQEAQDRAKEFEQKLKKATNG